MGKTTVDYKLEDCLRVCARAEEHGNLFEYHLSQAFKYANIEDNLKIQEAFPEFMKKFNKTSVQWYEEND